MTVNKYFPGSSNCATIHGQWTGLLAQSQQFLVPGWSIVANQSTMTSPRRLHFLKSIVFPDNSSIFKRPSLKLILDNP
jgi:hypothetical protein